MGDDYRCHIPRLPWHAGNDYRWGLAATAAQWVDRVIEAVPSRVSVVMAHSMGAAAVLRWLVADVDRDVDAIVLVSPYYRADSIRSGLSVLERMKSIDPEILDHIAGKFYDRAGPQAMMAVCEIYLSTAGADMSANKIPTISATRNRPSRCTARSRPFSKDFRSTPRRGRSGRAGP
ncbi:alpha/beta hydrolase [Streptomyces sp. ISL-43]|nr:alpha/beta hydrolase [Streptomyces sp. ISL-43]